MERQELVEGLFKYLRAKIAPRFTRNEVYEEQLIHMVLDWLEKNGAIKIIKPLAYREETLAALGRDCLGTSNGKHRWEVVEYIPGQGGGTKVVECSYCRRTRNHQ